MDPKIKKLLESNKIKFQSIGHRKVYTAFNAAETQHVETKLVAKTVLVNFSKPVVFAVDGEPVLSALVAVPSGKRVDLKKVAKTASQLQEKAFKAGKNFGPKLKKPAAVVAKLATEKDITKKLKTKVGLISPFGELYGLPVLLDKKLAGNKKILVSAGSYTESLQLAVKDYIKLNKPSLGTFTE